MRVCDICEKPKPLYILYEEAMEKGEFCRDCLNLIYDFIRCSRPPKVEQIDHIKTTEVSSDIDEKLKVEIKREFCFSNDKKLL